MGILKNIFAFLIGIGLLLFFYYHISIPIIPSLSIYPIMLLFENNSLKTRFLFVLLGTIIGVYIYSANAILSIINYPKYLKIIGIILEIVNVFAILTTGITFLQLLYKEIKNKIIKTRQYPSKNN